MQETPKQNKCPQCNVELERVLDEKNSGQRVGNYQCEIYFHRCPKCNGTHWASKIGGETTELCSKCANKGWYPEPYGEADDLGVQDIRERYCDCPRGVKLFVKEGG